MSSIGNLVILTAIAALTNILSFGLLAHDKFSKNKTNGKANNEQAAPTQSVVGGRRKHLKKKIKHK
jgi:hypothetical protein